MEKSILELKENYHSVLNEYEKLYPNSSDLKKDHCCQCGNCCWTAPCTLNKRDIIRIAKYMKISVVKFFYFYCVLEMHSRKYYDKFVVKLIRRSQKEIAGNLALQSNQWDTGPCIFFVDNKCLIHPVKPIEGKKCHCWIEKKRRYKPYKWSLDDLNLVL